MKFTILILKLAFPALLIVMIGANAGPFVEFLENKRDAPSFLSMMRETSKTIELEATESIYKESAIISDISFFQGDQIDITRNLESRLNGVGAVRVKIPITTNKKKFRLRLIGQANIQGSLKIYDQYQRLIASCVGADCNSLRFFVSRDSAIILVQTDNMDKSKSQILIEKLADFELDNTNQIPERSNEIPTIDLNLSNLGLQHLKHLVSTARLRAKVGSMDIPRQKIKGLMKCCGSQNLAKANVQVGLSGRGGGHFGVFPPSLSVSVISGQPIMGARKFKLIRPAMRHGLSEMVLSSIMKDFGLSVQSLNLVSLRLNGQDAGLHYFEEAVSSTFFENNKLNEGYIFGYSREKFFKPETPILEETILFSPPSRSRFREVNFTGDIFFEKVDKQELALISSVLAFFTGTHGLGADDLKFYEDPLTGVLEPFSRDFKVGAWPITLAGNRTSLNSHLSFLTMSTPPSVAAVFGDLSTISGYNTESLGVWDVHPSVKKLIANAKYRLLVERHILDLMENDFLNLFAERLKRAADTALSLDLHKTPTIYNVADSNRSYLQNELKNLGNSRNFSLSALLHDTIKIRPPLIFTKQDRWYILNGLPFSLNVNAISPNCNLLSGKTLVGPLTGVAELKPVNMKVADVILRYIDHGGVNHKSGYQSPLCELKIKAEEIPGLLIKLPNGATVQPVVMVKQHETMASREFSEDDFTLKYGQSFDSLEERSFIFSDGEAIRIRRDKHRFVSLDKHGNGETSYVDGKKLNLRTKDDETQNLNIKINGGGYQSISVVTRLDLDALSKSIKKNKTLPDNASILSIVYEGMEAKVEFFGFSGVTGGAAPNRPFKLSNTKESSEVQLTFGEKEATLTVDGEVIDRWEPAPSSGPNLIRIGDYNSSHGSNSHMRMDYVGFGVNTKTGRFHGQNDNELIDNFHKYVAVVPHDYIDNSDHVLISYAMHMTDNLSWNRQSLVLRSQALGGVTSTLGSSVKAFEVKTARNKFPNSNMEFFEAFNANRYDLFGNNSVIFKFKIEKTQENQFFEINKEDVVRLVTASGQNHTDDAIPYVLILDSKSHRFANFVPSMDIIEPQGREVFRVANTNQKNRNEIIKNALVEIETVLNNLKDDVIVAANTTRSRQYGQKFCSKANSSLNSQALNYLSKDALVNDKSKAILDNTPVQNLLAKISDHKSAEIHKNRIRIIEKPIDIKEGEVLRIPGGETWLLGPGASIEINGTLIIDGTKTNPVTLAPLNGKWPGLILKGANSQHVINHSLLFGMESAPRRFGAISVEKSTLNISNSILIELNGIDGINAHKSNLNIFDTIIGVTQSDIIDADFSHGEIKRSLFFKSDGDYIDVNQSKFSITENVLVNSFIGFGIGDPDKGVSCGEKSFCDINSNTFQNLTFGVAVKDGSFGEIDSNYFTGNMLGVAAFVKKPWFGQEHLELSKNVFNDNCYKYADLGELRY